MLAERRTKELQALYERRLQKYTVTIDKPKATQAQAAAAGGSGSR